ncbi:MAG: hypothetical protein HY534_04355 [Chloroflexi bacterium]|nr:hypothetical protein [Chloroflexota bacterium]
MLLPILFTRFRRSAVVTTISALLFVIVLAQLSSTLSVIFTVQELQYGESIIYDQAARVLRGEPLYLPHDRPPYSHTAYTPLYYWLVAELQGLLGPGFLPGRILTCIAGLATGGAIGYVVAQRTGSRWAGGLGAFLWLALGLPWVYPTGVFYPGDPLRTLSANVFAQVQPAYPNLPLYKEDLLGVALSVASIALLVRGRSPNLVYGAAILAALAFLTKQTYVSAGLAGALWLWGVDQKLAARFAAVGGGLTLGVSLALEVTSGAYFENVLFANVNAIRLDVLAANLPTLVQFQAGPALLAAYFTLRQLRRDRASEDGLLAYFWMASLPPTIGITRVGSSSNHWMILAASSVLLAALLVWRHLTSNPRPLTRFLLPVLPLLITLFLVSPLVGASRMRPSLPPPPDPVFAREYAALVERVRVEPRGVLAHVLDVVVQGDHPILLEPYVFSVLLGQGHWDPGPLVRRICTGQVGLLVFVNPLELGTGSYHGDPYWPLPVLKALQESMVFERTLAGQYLYVPRDPPPGIGAEGCAT